ncbi:MAG: nucleotidyltransferase [Spirochaetae bacterium HGW-Spirochaetae-1]|jgi:hypothetical protein|nr:MAG: nucleotidyltransferase [Spirochaetae bacterium HGW-Spirochaetae-1]
MGKKNLTIEDIRKVLALHRDALEAQYGVLELGLFGSMVRGEADEKSDIDILVSFSKNIDYFDFLDLEESLEKLLGMPVDLVERRALKPYIGERILNEMVIL